MSASAGPSEILRGKLLLSTYTRNPDWPKLRRKFLKLNPACAVCGATKRLTAHHIKPYQWYPELEMEHDNLITLCEGPGNHHLTFGHYMQWASYNENVVEDAAEWNKRIKSRPKWKRL